jgi:DNA-binding SARP family transcriptional activator
MDFRILGPLEVRDGDRAIPIGSGRQRALLALLILNASEPVSTDRIVDELWGERPPPSAPKVIQNHVSRLRRALGDGLLVTHGSGYALRLAAGQLDLDRFEQLVERAREAAAEADARRAAELLRRALGLWRGEPLADFAYAPFAQTEIGRLDERRLAAVEQLMEAELALGRHQDLVAELRTLVAAHPLRERLRAQLMLALYRSRRQAEALAVYQDGRRALVDGLGIDPGPELQQLERSILQQDRALELRARDAPTATPAVRDREPFVGREREQEALAAGLDEALAGEGRLFLLGGEPGVGKSRLAGRLAGRARAEGVRVLAGRCWEAGGAPAYWPWVQALQSHVRAEGAASVRAQAGDGARDLAQILPELGELFPDLPPLVSTDPEVARFRLFAAVTSFLKNAAAERGLVLLLDDLHVADAPSLLLLRFLARALGDSRLLVVAAYRDVDPALQDPLAAAIDEVSREPVARRVPLTGLHEEEVATLVAQTTGVEVPTSVAAAVYEESEGNPFFVGEIVRLLDAEGASGDASRRVPEGVRAVILRRVGRLSDECSETLVTAAVLGREFDLEAVARAAGRSRDALLDLLDEAARERVVVDVPGAVERRRFAHALIRDALYDEIPSGRRAQIERRVGETLEGLYEDDVEPHLAELAHHFLAAVPAAGTAKALDYARRAGDRAVALTAFEEAVRQYELALGVAPDGGVRGELLLALGEARARAGDVAAAKSTFLEAAELAERLGLPDQLGRAALGYGGRIVWDVQRGDEQLQPLLERALRLLGEEDDPLRVRLLSRLAAGPLRDPHFPSERRHALGRDALAMARRLDDPSTLAYALAASIAAQHGPASTEQQVTDSTELIEVAALAGEPERAVEAYDHLANALLELGDIDGAERALDAMAGLAETLRQPSQAFYVAEARAGLALLRGPLDEAERLIHASFELGRQILDWNARFTYGIQLYFLRRHQGRLHELAGMFESDENAARYRTYPIWDCLVMRFHDELGREPQASARFERLAESDFAQLPFDEEWLVAMGLLAEQAASLGDGARARTLYELLLPWADRVATSYSEACTGSVSRPLGLLAWTASRPEEAAKHFEDAIATNERIGALPWLAQTQEDYGRMLAGLEPDPARPLGLLRRAETTYAALGMSSHAQRASAAQASRGSGRAASPTS